VSLPFVTTFTVLKTQDGSPLPEEDVLKYYRGYYEKRGWKQSVFHEPTSEPYLELQLDLTQPAHPYFAVHLAGRLYLWVAPKDGMITVFVYQWRNSSVEGRLFNQVFTSLVKTSKALGYSLKEVEPQSSWAKYYEDENLVRMKALCFARPSDKTGSGTDREMAIAATILAYKDPAAAAEHREPADESREASGFFGKGPVILRENLVILLDPGYVTQDDALKEFVKNLTPAS
jgi:hypothetical protein